MIATPAFGLISGIGTALGWLPHVLALTTLLLNGISPTAILPLAAFTIGARVVGEWIFWNLFAKRMDSIENFRDWRTTLGPKVYSHPNFMIAAASMAIDAFADFVLVYIALKTSIPPIGAFLALILCQMLSAPIQGILSDYFSQKKSLILAAMVGMLALITAGEIQLDGKTSQPSMLSFLRMIGLSSFVPATQMMFILCFKGLFGNLTVVARGGIASVIKIETQKRIRSV